MKLRTAFFLTLLSAAAPALARQVHEENLNVSQVVQEIADECKIQPAFLSVTKRSNGEISYQLSPTLSSAQASCARGLLYTYNIYTQR
jgi:hypothetical protein